MKNLIIFFLNLPQESRLLLQVKSGPHHHHHLVPVKTKLCLNTDYTSDLQHSLSHRYSRDTGFIHDHIIGWQNLNP